MAKKLSKAKHTHAHTRAHAHTPAPKAGNWYEEWHKHPYHGHVHWVILAVAAVIVYLIATSMTFAR